MPPPHPHGHADIVHKALSSSIRREILLSIAKKPKYLSEIAAEAKKKPQTVDFHLNVLAELGIVDSNWSKGKKYYSIKDKKIADFLKDKKSIPIDFHPKPPHEIVLDAWADLAKRMDRIEKKLDDVLKKL